LEVATGSKYLEKTSYDLNQTIRERLVVKHGIPEGNPSGGGACAIGANRGALESMGSWPGGVGEGVLFGGLPIFMQDQTRSDC
jgi:hypothetical protein